MKDSFDKAHVVFFAIVVLFTTAFYSVMHAIGGSPTGEYENNVDGINVAWGIYAVVVVAAYAPCSATGTTGMRTPAHAATSAQANTRLASWLSGCLHI